VDLVPASEVLEGHTLPFYKGHGLPILKWYGMSSDPATSEAGATGSKIHSAAATIKCARREVTSVVGL
jgi:hypothetical protein